MRYSILGFNQEKILSIKKVVKKNDKDVEIKLDVTDLLILQDIADFMNRNKVIKHTIDDKIYFSMQYQTILEDLPILTIQKQALADRIDKMSILGLLEKKVIKNQCGTFTAFRLGEQYENILYSRTSSQTTPTSSQLQVQEYLTTNHNTNITNNSFIEKEKEDKSSLKKSARKQNECEWRKDYEAYKQLVLSAKDQLLNDQQAKQNLLFMYPNADYYRTVLKSVEFWCSEKGWEYKKKSTAKDINMLSTLKNNLNKNIVYRNVNDQPIENLQKLNISVNEQGICADGTFIRGAYRYYHSMRDNKDYSIPIQALPMPNERCEFNMKTQSWYLPYENENTDDLLW
jgi:hypothetical protein